MLKQTGWEACRIQSQPSLAVQIHLNHPQARLSPTTGGTPEVDIGATAIDQDLRAAERLHQAYSFLANAYLWEPDTEPLHLLPRQIAVPYVALSKIVDRPPVLSYAGTQLCNWRRLDLETHIPRQHCRDPGFSGSPRRGVVLDHPYRHRGDWRTRGHCRSVACEAHDKTTLTACLQRLRRLLRELSAITAPAERIEEGADQMSSSRLCDPSCSAHRKASSSTGTRLMAGSR